jgi:hypothetical protein
MRSLTWFEAALPPFRMTACVIRTLLEQMHSCRLSPCFPSHRLRYSPLTNNGWKAIWGVSMVLHTFRVTRRCGRDAIRSPLHRCAPRSRASLGNSSEAQRLNRWRVLMDTIDWPSMAQAIFPPRRFTVRRVCTRSTATGRSPLSTRCWAPR